MNINVQKITDVVIKDTEGKVTMKFPLGMVTVSTMADNSQVLEIRQAKPKAEDTTKWKHDVGDTVMAWDLKQDCSKMGKIITMSKDGKLELRDKYGFVFNSYSANVGAIIEKA